MKGNFRYVKRNVSYLERTVNCMEQRKGGKMVKLVEKTVDSINLYKYGANIIFHVICS